jgi:cell surface protein SprA
MYSAFAIVGGTSSENIPQDTQVSVAKDTLRKDSALIYPLAKPNAQTLQEKDAKAPIDLKNPKNITSNIEYDPITKNYVIRTKIGNEDIETPYVLNSDEYKEYSFQRAMEKYWKEKNDKNGKNATDVNSLTNLKFDIGKGDEIFGPGGVQVKTQGSTELSFGLKTNSIQNPTLTTLSQNPPPTFDFNEKIQLNVKGTVGDKVSVSMNYNTEAPLAADQKVINMTYQGKEDEILQKLEAGNVSMPLTGSLITGSTALFGIKTQLKFGRLTVDAVISQQESDAKTISMKNGAQTTPFQITVDKYDANRHFFLAQYFRDNFDKAMASLPYINSPVKISRIEVWVTNKKADYTNARNIIAFADLGETSKIYNSFWTGGGSPYPANQANKLYSTVTDTVNFVSTSGANIRDITSANTVIDGRLNSKGIIGGNDYEVVESARLLGSSEYTFNPQLGFISLKAALSSDDVVGVAYQFTAGGVVYQVGEFSTDNISAPKSLVVKMLKGTNLSPKSPTWNLMMKNVYALGGYQVQKDKFVLNIMYKSDSTGVYLNYIPNTPLKNNTLLTVMNLDRLDNNNQARPDGQFDYVEGNTIVSATGRVIFPEVEPFGSHLAQELGNNSMYNKYLYQQLYDSTLTVAQQYTSQNKFILKGQYKASSGSEIKLNAMNVPKGSVTVTAGGVKLVENADYTVDYTMGIVNIINTSILDSGTAVDVSLESQSNFSTLRKTLVGTHLDYKFNKDFNIGGTIMHLAETPLTQNVAMGNEPISNTVWGLNSTYKTESQWLTNALDKIPFLKVKEPSRIAINGEFANIIPGHSSVINNYVYLDDFESTNTGIDIRYPTSWKLASTPSDVFTEGTKINDVSYGYNRALLSWYTIDPIFTENTTDTPANIRTDLTQLSNHFVRSVLAQEVYPDQQPIYGQSSYLTILNLTYYPNERGPYNLDWQHMTSTGYLTQPATRWGGIMRSLQTTDFEAANIEYIQFWVMDPFIYNTKNTMTGGDLYFNLGDISEDILKDGQKSFESGLPINGDTTLTIPTAWGRVPKEQSMVYAFQGSSTKAQDVGLDGLSDQDELQFGAYKNFVAGLKTVLSASTIQAMQKDPFSPLNDPAGDDYHYFRGTDYDNAGLGVIDRYKRYNGVEGNSPDAQDSPESYSTAASALPDVEDLNQDNTMNEYERFYEYKVSIRPADMVVGQNFITDKVTSNVALANGTTAPVTWYQFKIPISSYVKQIGGISDFTSIRFIRMFLTNFTDTTHLRFADLELVRGSWRAYNSDFRYNTTQPTISNGQLDVSSVNIEEDASRQPVNYLLPPGITRVIDPSQPQVRQENEQSMTLKVTDLAPKDARAVYKNTMMDLRQYKHIQMFTHAEQLLADNTNLKDYELTAFIRLGSDNTDNFYEYEIPLKLTPARAYNSNLASDDLLVWPTANMFDFDFSILTQAKLQRDASMNGHSTVSLTQPFFEYDKGKPQNKITVMGNPSLSDLQVIMIGIRNQSGEVKSGEIWVDELRLSNMNEEGGYAALANMVVNLSDLGTVTVSGRTESAGYGSIDQNVAERNIDETYQYNVATGLELGKFFPAKDKIKIPFYYSYSQNVTNPTYNPLDQDILLSAALANAPTKAAKDSLSNLAQTVVVNKSISLSNVKVDIHSKQPKLYDPGNFSVSYIYNETDNHDAETQYQIARNYKGVFNYIYNSNPKPIEPFSSVKFFNNNYLKLIKDFNFNYMPTYISYTSNMNRSYSELQSRNLTEGSDEAPSFSDNITWAKNFDIKYDFSKSLKFTFSSATNSIIDEPYTIVNQSLYPDEYKHWKDSVWSNIARGGRPLQYQQMATASYALPLNKVPILNWTSLNTQYSSNYSWATGVTANVGDQTINTGNTANDITNYQFDGRLNFEALYKKSNYLNKINEKFSPKKDNKGQKKYTEKVSLKTGVKKEIKHRLGSNDINLTAVDEKGNSYPLKFKIVDANTIMIEPKEDINNLSINIVPATKEESPMTIIKENLTRFLMMVRNVSGNYKESNSLTLPGFQGGTGLIGQDNYNNMKVPGYGFVFGFYNPNSFVQKAKQNNWLINDTITSNPIMINSATDLQLKATIEPIPGLKIDLNSSRTTSQSQSIQYYNGVATRTVTGTFSMTDMAIGTSLWKIGNAASNYDSKAYNNFLNYRTIIAARIEQQYTNGGNPLYSGYNINSADVLIPAFLAAYTNKDPVNTSLNPFPSLLSMMPNWRITYDGLSKLEFSKKYFKSVNLTHAYRCVYNIGSYSSNLDWQPGPNANYGYIHDVLDSDPNSYTIPSSPYNIGCATITESFSPLLGIDVTTKDNILFKVEYKRARTLSLDMSSTELVESTNNEWVVGSGYKIKDFNMILRLKQKQTKVKNDLTLRGDLSIKSIQVLIRQIDQNISQPTSGSEALTLKMTANYVFSEKVNICLYYDRMTNTPLISSSYPTISSDFGVTFKFLLTR